MGLGNIISGAVGGGSGGLGNITSVISGAVGGIGGGGGSGWEPNNAPTSTLTSEQNAALVQLLEQLQGAGPAELGFQGEMGSALQSLLSGKPAYEINPETTEQYYQDTIYNPAMQEYENVTRPGMLESMGSLHSGTRMNMERTSRQDLASNLSGQRADLYYKDEMAKRQAAMQAQQMQLGGIGAGNQMNQVSMQAQQMPIQNLLAAIGLPAMENIVSQPGLLEGGLNNPYTNPISALPFNPF